MLVKGPLLLTWMNSWWRHQMETLFALLAHCEGNPLVTSGFPSQRPVTRSFDVFFNLHLDKQLSEQSRRWWFETPSRSLWRQRNVKSMCWWPVRLPTMITIYVYRSVIIELAMTQVVDNLNESKSELQIPSTIVVMGTPLTVSEYVETTKLVEDWRNNREGPIVDINAHCGELARYLYSQLCEDVSTYSNKGTKCCPNTIGPKKMALIKVMYQQEYMSAPVFNPLWQGCNDAISKGGSDQHRKKNEAKRSECPVYGAVECCRNSPMEMEPQEPQGTQGELSPVQIESYMWWHVWTGMDLNGSEIWNKIQTVDLTVFDKIDVTNA